ncbi:hypothetical protein DL770_004009 [Monosporascus sp. CRB-9-2]|nr:hypothetical protein DL770_004009 [Monosporascus sp. CRB-9-2]
MGSTQENKIHKELAPLIIEGLKFSPRFFPSLLLWDAKGIQIYERIMCSKDYYLTYTEAELIRLNADSIVDKICSNSVILELGSGCLSKTIIILDAIARKQKPVTYYALDVCPSTLAASLIELRLALDHSPYVTCFPLCMTYQDGILWLANEPSLVGKSISVLWLGSSFANESPEEFRGLLNGMSAARAQNSRIAELQFLVTADGTKDPDMVSHAYDTRDGLSRAFTLNVLDNANQSLGRAIFDTRKWCFDGAWDPEEGLFQTCIQALEDQVVRIGGEQVRIRKREKVKVITSRKLGENEVRAWLVGTGFTISDVWTHPKVEYTLYRFVTNAKAAD